jgi:hypothetical protein
MIRIVFVLVLMNLSFFLYCQVRATTEDGRKVILYDNFSWKYADDDEIPKSVTGINRIEVDSNGLVRVDFMADRHRISFFDGKVFFNNMQEIKLEYYTNSFFAKSVGKIKEISFNNITVEFEYHQNSIFKESEGKIKEISIGNQAYQFEYHQNSYFAKSVGKLKEISSGSYSVEFEYYENPIYPETEGKLKEIKGEIPGIRILYLD